ncbi:hypothetical protein L1887_17124 [Cichorium endivia]|nr:hypothetical protein L1887_17124 [Cichorium endivia]
MGIKDLLRFMKPYVEPVHIKKFAGKRVGIDAYSWLHKGGNRDLAMAKLKEGNINAAKEMFQRAVSITPSMAHQLIEILKSENIEFVVAPYEADAQLAYLSSLDAEDGGIAAIISEGSDLLAYGCSSVVFKMDRYGNGEEIVIDKVFRSVGHVPSFLDFDKELFTGMCRDVCSSWMRFPSIGATRNRNCKSSCFGFQVSELVPCSFKQACAVFQHARIYDSDSKRLKPLTPLPKSLVHELGSKLDFLGPLPIQPSSNRGLKQKTTTDGCFTIVSSQKTGIKRITVMEQEMEPKVNVEEWRCLSGTSSLKKLISPLNNSIPSRDDAIPAKRSSTIPDNNPFMRRKKHLWFTRNNNLQSITGEELGVTEFEDLELLCIIPDSQKSVDSESVNKIGDKIG